ncbi:TadE/TadG family type IV pilus assembly protein [uncultured Dialister sp.]|uniref:TadE/TadG family type IV pilus assembly protein n=1 Tax=uncultured Dialister sp. TaxID=278064 RepID=UPI0026DC5E85|nr:TadE family protein [uncultured Dialister sp.]
MKKQGGQDIIEFTLMVPLFFVCLFAIMAGGLFFRDYITYNSVVRSAAREASLVVAQGVSDKSEDQPQKFKDISNQIYNAYNGQDKNHPHLYIVNSPGDITIEGVEMGNDNTPSIEVKLTATKNTGGNGFINGVANAGIILPDTQQFTYYMYWENNTKNNSKVQP